ncbi:MAG: hypothetical protein R3C44_12600 [Chloroflexota bacterium]
MAGNGPLRRSDGLFKQNTLFGETIEIGGGGLIVTITAQAVGTLRVQYDKENIGSRHRFYWALTHIAVIAGPASPSMASPD